MSSSFESKLEASLESAAQQNRNREEMAKAAKDAEAEKQRAWAANLSEKKTAAIQFRSNKLEPLFARAQDGIQNKLGFVADRQSTNADDEGPFKQLGVALHSGSKCWLSGDIRYVFIR